MKKAAYLLLGFILITLFSCLEGDDDVVTLSSDPEIYSFRLTDADSVTNKVRFSIDQVNNRIYNADSIGFGLVVGKAKCTLTSKNSVRMIFFPDASDKTDSIVWNGSDSLDFSKPSRMQVYSQDRKYSKTYDITIGVYSIKADSFVWEQTAYNFIPRPFVRQRTLLMPDSSMYMYVERPPVFELYASRITDGAVWTAKGLQDFPAEARVESIQRVGENLYVADKKGKLYKSADGLQWGAANMPSTDSVAALLGSLNGNLEMIVKRESALYLASYSAEEQNITETEPLPGHFPVEGFTSLEYHRNYHYHLVVLGGRDRTGGEMLNEVWTKIGSPGQTWIRVYDHSADRFSPREGALLLPYDNKLMLIGGYGLDTVKKEDGTIEKIEIEYLRDIYFSKDQGITWALGDSLKIMPHDFTPRAFASAMVDNRSFVTIVGGQNTEPLNDLWRGRIHRLAK